MRLRKELRKVVHSHLINPIGTLYTSKLGLSFSWSTNTHKQFPSYCSILPVTFSEFANRGANRPPLITWFVISYFVGENEKSKFRSMQCKLKHKKISHIVKAICRVLHWNIFVVSSSIKQRQYIECTYCMHCYKIRTKCYKIRILLTRWRDACLCLIGN